MASRIPRLDLVPVLVVDDRPERRSTLEALLDALGVEPLWAASAEEAAFLAARREPAVVLLAESLSSGSGLEVAERLRAAPASRDVPIVFVSPSPEDLRWDFVGCDAGPVDWLGWPVAPALLRSKVEVFGERRRWRRPAEEREGRRAAPAAREPRPPRESEDRLRSLFELAPVGMVHASLQGHILAANARYRELTGYSAEELRGLAVTRLTHPDDVEAMAAHDASLLEGRREAYAMEKRYVRKDGSVVCAHLAVSLVRDERGEATHFVGVVEDSTERRRVEEALRAEEEFAEVVLQSVPGILYVRRADGRLVRWNRRLEEFLGLAPEDVAGVRLPDRMPEESRRVASALAREVFEEGRQVDAEFCVRDGEGREVPFYGTASPMQVGDHRYLVGLWFDHSERRRARGALLESERRYRELFERTSDGISIVDVGAGGRFTGVELNPAAEAFLGLPTADIWGRTFEEFLPPQVAAEVTARYRRCLEGGVPISCEEYLPLSKGGGTFQTTLIPVRNEQDRIHRILAVARDTTERRRLEREKEAFQTHLAQTQKLEAVGTLAGGIAHDFNNILGAILGYADMALEELPSDSEMLRAYLGRLVRAAERASALTRQILAFSRQARRERHLFQVRPLVKEVLKLLRATLPSTVEVRQELGTEGLVLADPSEVHQVLLNLSTNAGLAMPEGGVLTVGLDEVDLAPAFVAEHPGLEPGPFVRLAVRDTGCGIPPELLGRVFEPFFTTRPEGQGTGLGLSVVHGIAASCGGTVTVTSQPGHGTTFEVFFPRAEGEASTAQERRKPVPGRERILFIDDEEMLVDIARRRLGVLGYRVEGFTSSHEALEAFRADPAGFDAVVSDVTMPGLTGDELAQEVRRLRTDVPIVLATGYSQRLNAERVQALGAAVLDKPVLPDELTRRLRELLDRR